MMSRKIGNLILLYLFAGISIFAQTRTQSSLSSNEVYVGQSVQLRFSTNSRLVSPDTIEFPGMNTQYQSTGTSSMVSIINGKKTSSNTFSHSFLLTPKGPGRFVLGPFTVETEDGPVIVNAGVVNVIKPQKNENFSLRIEVPREEYYVGEPIFLDIIFTAYESLSNLAISIPALEGKFIPLVSEDSESVMITINNYRVYFNREGDSNFVTRVAFIPESAGLLSFSNSIAEFRGRAGSRKARDFFGNVVESDVYENLVIIADSKDVTVKNLPPAPDGKFSGLVGRDFELIATLPVEEVFVGDPIRLSLTIKGSYDTRKLDRSAINFDQIVDNFSVEYEGSEVDSSFENIHSYLVRPLNAKTDELDSISLLVFDTKSQKYTDIISPKIKLKVKDTKILSTSDVFSSSQEELADPILILEPMKPAKLEIFSAEQVLNNRKSLAAKQILSIVVIVVSIILILLLIIFFLVKKINSLSALSPYSSLKKSLSHIDGSPESLTILLNTLRSDSELRQSFASEIALLHEHLFSPSSTHKATEILAQIKNTLRGLK
ncbi:MAG: BatD family protein [Spirochaetales bacterium]|nr:BatD family protein [Spirochaetales bacterium]